MDLISLGLACAALNDGCGDTRRKRQRAIKPRRMTDVEMELGHAMGRRPSQEDIDRVLDLARGKHGKTAVAEAIKQYLKESRCH